MLQRVGESVDFQTAYRELYPSLHRFVLRMTGDADVADDVVQEAFTRLIEQDLPLSEAKPWLYVVAANLVRDDARTKQRRGRLLEETPPEPSRPEAPDARMERLEKIARVRMALGRLSDRDARMLLMREEGFKYSEIAVALGVKSTSVGALVARALKRFAQAYDSVAAVKEADGTHE